ncbi:NDP-sugar synthase [bacterium]|nr:NDP-sugar synthase [bacterium]NCQ55558.1 NDP-sugar synthase [Candidatus Parcubacteria bacterium]NCS67383.1 NDP-sugar synthase [Candidatus Peregrinibacteria bacterium]NCS96109.1 NDP-sugar synthase [bacterium]
MKAFILAGGFATRLWPLTEHRAKPMLLVNGEPILAHILNQIPAETEVFLLTNSRFEPDFKTFLKTQNREVEIFCEDTHCDSEKLGALAAVATAIKHYNIEDNLLVLAGDNLLPELDLNELIPSDNTALLALKNVPDLESAKSFGVVEFADIEESKTGLRAIQTFIEKPEQPKSAAVSTGFMGIGKNLLPVLLEFSEKSPDALGAIITEFLHQNFKVSGLLVEGDWFDVGSYEAYLSAHKSLQSKDLLKGKSVEITHGTFEGKVYLGDGVRIENSVVIDSVIYPGVKLKNCHISQCVIDENCDFSGVDLSRKLVRQKTKVHSEEKI